MRSDWHRYNLKRRVAELPPVSTEDYNERVTAAQATNKAAADQAAFQKSCSVCRKSYFSDQAYQQHITSKMHRQREAAAASGEAPSVNGSTLSKTESHTTEAQDPEVKAEFEKVVEAMKHTSVQEPIQRRPSAPPPDAEPRKEHPLSPAQPEKPTFARQETGPEKPLGAADVPLSRCLFCNYESPTWKLSVSHMTKIHGLFIPEQNYIVDLLGLLGYLQAKIHQNNECLWCHKLKNTSDGIQTHMRDKGHCRIAFESEEEMIEVGQFYDFSSTYSEPGEDTDTEMDEAIETKRNGGVRINGTPRGTEDDGWETDSSFSSLDSNDLTSVPMDDRTESYNRLPMHRHHSQTDPRPHKNIDGFHSHAHHHNNAVFYDEYEMHLPSGRVAGHRSLKKYYSQNLHSYPTVAERAATAQRLIEEGSGEDENMEDVDRPGPNPATPPKSQALMRRGEAGMIGVTNAQRREVKIQEQRSRTKEQRAQNRYQAKLEKQHNSQKHFRVSRTFQSWYLSITDNHYRTLCSSSQSSRSTLLSQHTPHQCFTTWLHESISSWSVHSEPHVYHSKHSVAQQ